MPVEGVEHTRGFKPQRVLNPSLGADRPLPDKDLEQSAEKWTSPGTNTGANPVDILAQLSASERPDVLARLLSAWHVPEATAGLIVGLLEATQLGP